MTTWQGIRKYVKEKETDEQFIQRIVRQTETYWDKVLKEKNQEGNFYGTFIPFSKEDYNRIEQLIDEINLLCERFELVLNGRTKNYIYLKPKTKDDKS